MLKAYLKVIYSLVGITAILATAGCSSLFPEPTPTPTNTPIPPTSTPIPTDTPIPTETPTEIPTSTPLPTIPPLPTASPTATKVIGGKPIYFYFVLPKSGGNVACGDSLAPLTSGKYQTGDVEADIMTALQQLFSFHMAEFGELYNPLYKSNLKVDSVEFYDGTQTIVELSGDYVKTEDDCDPGRVLAMIQATIRQFPDTGSLDINLNGAGIKNYVH